MYIGERIRQLRLSQHLTQEELGAKIGVKKAAINKYETGVVVNLKRSTIELLSTVFQVSPAYLMGLDDPAPAPSLSPDEEALLTSYRSFSPEGQEKVQTYVADLERAGIYKNSDQSGVVPKQA